MRLNFYAGTISLLACIGYSAEANYATADHTLTLDPYGALELSQAESFSH